MCLSLCVYLFCYLFFFLFHYRSFFQPISRTIKNFIHLTVSNFFLYTYSVFIVLSFTFLFLLSFCSSIRNLFFCKPYPISCLIHDGRRVCPSLISNRDCFRRPQLKTLYSNNFLRTFSYKYLKKLYGEQRQEAITFLALNLSFSNGHVCTFVKLVRHDIVSTR